MKATFAICLLLLLPIISSASPVTSQELWTQYAKSPNTHPNIPNNSYAGYRQSDVALPSVEAHPPTFTVSVFGAKGDGVTDDTAAFQTALKQLESRRTGGILFVPPGKYKLSGVLRLGSSHMILRGAGEDQTTLIFGKSLSAIYGPSISDGSSEYSWLGGLIHIGPKENFTADGKLDKEAFYSWGGGDNIARVIQPAKRGDFKVTVDRTSNLKAGEKMFLAWSNPPDHSLLKAMAGPVLSAYPWDTYGTLLTERKAYKWPVLIDRISGNTVILKQPLRLDIRPEWQVAVQTTGHVVEEIGVENLCIKMIAGESRPHLQQEGYNGIYFHRVWNSWARNVRVEDADSGVLMDAAKNVTVTGLKLTGTRRLHHGTFTKGSHDCLIEDFEIDAPVIHGINSDLFTTGTVWRRGMMKHGTFDMHRGMPFDLIRTDITVNNDGHHGGDDTFGPLQGIHAVHWNIRATGRSDLVYQPDVMPMGALVGIQGIPADLSESDENHVKGDKGCEVADHDKIPNPSDLFQAQVDLRHSYKKQGSR